MKKLILIRHAKSDWSIPDQDDFDRGLSKRGKRQIKSISKIIHIFDVQKIICSSSNRTVLTYNGLAKRSSKFAKIPVEFNREVYDIHQKNVIEFVDIVRNFPNDIDSIAVIGHNSMFDDALKYLTNVSGLHIPTLGIVEICFDSNIWNNVYKGTVLNFITPKK